MKRRSLLLAPLLALCVYSITQAQQAALQVGSKNFTESVILGELVQHQARALGLSVQHRPALGGSAILWRALQDGSIDLYPEYTGTLTQELLPDAKRLDRKALTARLASLGIGLSEPLGFDNGYALGMRREQAEALGIARLSDLRAHPRLRFGLSNEFMNRGDGWPGLRTRYQLDARQVRGMDHDLAYRAIESGDIDVIDLYTTDAEIAYYDLRALQDDRTYFPRYDAVLLYRTEAYDHTPALRRLLDSLAGRIDRQQMRAMNAAVKIEGRTEAEVAREFLGQDAAAGKGASAGRLLRSLWQRTLEHLALVGLSLLLALMIGLPLGILAAQRPRLSQAVLSATSVLQTIPALAMLVFLIPLLGIGAQPAIAALLFYSLLPIVRNTVAGLDGIAQGLRESAAALGLPAMVRLLRIDLPLALPMILAGISTAAVINIGTATLGALIGAGGYGQPILTGIRLDNITLILEGAVPAAAMALLTQQLFRVLERHLSR